MQKETLSPIFGFSPEEQNQVIQDTIPSGKMLSVFPMKYYKAKESIILKIKKFFNI
ncbi:MAG: hypothetical protein PHR68_02535 [Candidatus Gracilibacteria bacterium]|nr:hypothetical protein [Candidatus Gracilibacteria bacterium]